MQISVLGLGYVGTVVAGCLARAGHEVIGIDAEPRKVELVNSGKSPIIEKELDQVIAQQVEAGRLSATTEVTVAIQQSDVILVCVGTPSRSNGDIELRHVRRVCEQIGAALRVHPGAPVVVVRSTLLPGTMRELVIPTLEASSGRHAGTDFGVCVNPEFLREGTAVHDYLNPPKTVIGELTRASGDVLASLYAGIPAPLIRTDIETAEMVKYADNAWHALKVGFANEIGNLCKALQMDSHRVMEIFCQDTKLNLSSCYLRPGFAFGGSCLPKDLRALLHKAKSLDVSLPILAAVLPSNELQIERALQTVIDHGNRKVGILGFSFKAGSDDLRNSPVVELTERLLGKGFELRIYDGAVRLASIHGANRDYILHRIPHISGLMVSSIDEVLEHADTIVIGNAAPEFRDIPRRLGLRQTLIDLVRVSESRSASGVYEGICW
ncbi:MAG: nucleotide sugar dehydrogenase [Gammaproteobacteria bacterium]|nr:MAG: nucleotide sugar dehydrogenase [Gammaproteobacteria bacterium]TLZ33213.1 MAG: nucleotide sugar dehydrogenase [Gammaproteobacteria bacterium]TLZ47042.1 MAG: nucleotide sugar dehydrogenase [Gammaproteobacteria bacterium]